MPACWLVNSSTRTVYVAFGTSSVQAAMPTTAAPVQGFAFLSTAARCFQMGPNPDASGWVSIVTSLDSSAMVFITPGIGF